MPSQPSAPDIPPPPKYSTSYKEGAQVYLKYLPKFLNAEMDTRRDPNYGDTARIEWQQGLQDKYGPHQYEEMLSALRSIDPTGYNLREQTGKSLSNDLRAGYGMTADQEQALEQQIRRSQGRTGNAYGQAPVQAEAFSKGMTGFQMHQQRLQNAINFQNAATPEQWMQMIPPVSADRSMAYVNPNAGFQGAQFDLQNYQNMLAQAQLSQQGQSSGSPIGGAIGSVLGGVVGGYFGGPVGAQAGGSIGGTAGNWIGSAFSDRRLKSNISKVNELANGIGVYDFDMFGKRYRGVIADEVEKVMPEAVRDDALTGFKVVDYAKVGIAMERVS